MGLYKETTHSHKKAHEFALYLASDLYCTYYSFANHTRCEKICMVCKTKHIQYIPDGISGSPCLHLPFYPLLQLTGKNSSNC